MTLTRTVAIVLGAAPLGLGVGTSETNVGFLGGGLEDVGSRWGGIAVFIEG